jgi:hypothetical protein
LARRDRWARSRSADAWVGQGRDVRHAGRRKRERQSHHLAKRIHLIVEHVADLSSDLKRVAESEGAFPVMSGRGDDAKRGGSGLDSREPKPSVSRPRDMYEPDLHIDSLKIRARNFR